MSNARISTSRINSSDVISSYSGGRLYSIHLSDYNKNKLYLKTINDTNEMNKNIDNILKNISNFGFEIKEDYNLRSFLFKHPIILDRIVNICKELSKDFADVNRKILFINTKIYDDDEADLEIGLIRNNQNAKYSDRIDKFYEKPCMSFLSSDNWIHITDFVPGV